MEPVHDETYTTHLRELTTVKVLYLMRKLGEVEGAITFIISCDSISSDEKQAQMNSLITDARNQISSILKEVEGFADQCVKTTESVYNWIVQKGNDLPTPKPKWWCEAVEGAISAAIQFHFVFISVNNLLDGKDRDNDTLIRIIGQASEAVKLAARFLTTTLTKIHAAGW
jgi:hypothetical protein